MAERFIFNPFTGNFDAVSDPIAFPFEFGATCLSSDNVGDVVRVSGPLLAGVPQVTRVDITDWNKMPGIGILTRKASSTECSVAYFGAVALSFALTPGRPYFASAAGPPTDVRPSSPCFVQIVGIALDGGRLFLQPSWNLTRLI